MYDIETFNIKEGVRVHLSFISQTLERSAKI